MDAMRDNAEASVHMFEGELVSYIRPSFLPEGGSVLPQSDYPFETRPFRAKSFNLASYTSNMTRVVSFDIQILWCDISNTRRSVSFDFQAPISYISNTRRSISSDMQTLRSNI